MKIRNSLVPANLVGAILLSLISISLSISLHAQAVPQRTIHVFVALADNQNQGIVPVPARLGNGLDPVHNLYWGAAAGVKTFFARSRDWGLLYCRGEGNAGERDRPKPSVLERCVFKYRTAEVYLVADAYRGMKFGKRFSTSSTRRRAPVRRRSLCRPGRRI